MSAWGSGSPPYYCTRRREFGLGASRGRPVQPCLRPRAPSSLGEAGGGGGYGPPPVGKQHGLYVIDVGDGEHRPC